MMKDQCPLGYSKRIEMGESSIVTRRGHITFVDTLLSEVALTSVIKDE